MTGTVVGFATNVRVLLHTPVGRFTDCEATVPPLDWSRVTALSHLSGHEAVLVLGKLLAAHPELRDEAETIAREAVETIPGGLAEELRTSIMQLDIEVLSGRTGYQPGQGWVEPYDVADEILDEVVEAFLADAVRRAEAGAAGTGITMGLDIIKGLYSLPIPTELDSTVLFSFCGEDFAHQRTNAHRTPRQGRRRTAGIRAHRRCTRLVRLDIGHGRRNEWSSACGYAAYLPARSECGAVAGCDGLEHAQEPRPPQGHQQQTGPSLAPPSAPIRPAAA
ncbi:hypothetical protein GCM10022419_024160 [Nonomuraea rosea]|uniref:Mycothiol-dependent maleylpyruvate isomerase metal-binding domain-containing protein n=1 Tax=Nonomuraea rosea TaxID=638574 RepID=A0ABP6VYW6_9ACTN